MILEAAGLLIAAPRPGHGPTSSPRARHAQHAIPATHSSHTAAQSRLTSKSPITPLLVNVLLEYVPTADELGPGTCYIVDGTLLPCWSWRAHPDMYSGKHKTTGMNVQVVCAIDGRLAWISDPISGSRHDNHCLGESGALVTLDPRNWVGDKGYVGNNMITPFKKPAGGELLDWQKDFNTQVNKIRYVIEQVIANFKTW